MLEFMPEDVFEFALVLSTAKLRQQNDRSDPAESSRRINSRQLHHSHAANMEPIRDRPKSKLDFLWCFVRKTQYPLKVDALFNERRQEICQRKKVCCPGAEKEI